MSETFEIQPRGLTKALHRNSRCAFQFRTVADCWMVLGFSHCFPPLTRLWVSLGRSASCVARMLIPLTTYQAGRRGSVSFSLDTLCQDLRRVLCFDLRLAYSRRQRFHGPSPSLRFPCRVFARRLLCSRVPNGVWCSRALTPNNALHRNSRCPFHVQSFQSFCSFWLRPTTAAAGCG